MTTLTEYSLVRFSLGWAPDFPSGRNIRRLESLFLGCNFKGLSILRPEALLYSERSSPFWTDVKMSGKGECNRLEGPVSWGVAPRVSVFWNSRLCFLCWRKDISILDRIFSIFCPYFPSAKERSNPAPMFSDFASQGVPVGSRQGKNTRCGLPHRTSSHPFPSLDFWGLCIWRWHKAWLRIERHESSLKVN